VSDLRERLAAAVDDAVPAVRVTRALRAFAAWLRDEAAKDRAIAEHAALYTTRRRYIAMAEAFEERADAIDPQPERTAT